MIASFFQQAWTFASSFKQVWTWFKKLEKIPSSGFGFVLNVVIECGAAKWSGCDVSIYFILGSVIGGVVLISIIVGIAVATSG